MHNKDVKLEMQDIKYMYIKKYYHDMFMLDNKHLLSALKLYSNLEGDAISEELRCCFANDYEKWEEDYFGESGVAYYFDYPAVEEDCTIILSNEEFYKYLVDECKDYIKKYPKDEDVVHNYLSVIKKKLKL